MRLLIFAAYYLPHVGGYITDMHQFAKSMVQLGCKVDVLACNTEHVATREDIDGVSIYRIPSWDLLDGQYPIPKPCLKLLMLMFSRYDVVSTQTRFFFSSFLGALYAFFTSKPHIHTERGGAHSIVSSRIVNMLGKMYDHTFGSLVVKLAYVNIGISEASCQFIKHLGGKNPIRIPQGIPSQFFEQMRNDNGQKVILFTGRLVYGKGVQDLIEAFKNIRVKIPGANLVIVGDGAYRQELEDMSGGDGRIRFIGEVPYIEIPKVLSVASVFVNPSYSEGQPSSVAEAAAIGLPVIATDVGGTNELVVDGITGYLVKAGDVKAMSIYLYKLLSDKALAAKMGSLGRIKMLAEYQVESVADKYMAVLERLIGKD